MRCLTLLLLTLVAFPGCLLAQNGNQMQIWDQTVEFVSRGANASNPGHVSQGFQYGFQANLRTIRLVSYGVQEQNLATQEPWDVGTCGLDTRGLPDYANLRPYATDLRLPISSGVGAFQIVHNPLRSSPHKLTENPCEQWHHVWKFKVTTNWTTDGLSVAMSDADPWMNTRLCGRNANNTTGHREISRIDAYSGSAQQIRQELDFSNVASNPDPNDLNRTWRLQLWFDEVVLQGMSANTIYNGTPCPNPNPGYAAIDPNLNDLNGQSPARFDNPTFELRAGQKFANGVAILFTATTVFPGGGIATPYGQLHLNLADPLFAAGPILMPPLSSTGVSQITLDLGSGTSPLRSLAAELGCWHAQAVAVSTKAEIELSSLWTMRTKLLTTGFTRATAYKGNPHRVSRNAVPGLLLVRNDGRGQLVVQGKDSAGNNRGAAVTVCERSCVQLPLIVGVATVEFASPSNAHMARPTVFVYRML